MQCQVGSNEHGRYCVPLISKHRPAARAILAGRVYEPKTIALLRDIPGAIIHAGTYFGDFLPALAQSREAKVYAFEPNPINYHCALITSQINGLTNVELTHAGLGDAAGELPLKIWGNDARNLGGGSHFFVGAKPEQTIPVPMVRLDDVIPTHEQIAVLQLDVEFHEPFALAGARGIIERWRPVLVLETVPSLDWLFAMGYEQQAKVHWNHVLRAFVD